MTSISGSPTPSLEWILYSMDIKTFVEDSFVTKSEEKATVEIANAKRDMSGEYQCVADNGFNDGVTKTVNVVVEYPPTIEISESFIVSDMSEQQVGMAKTLCNYLSFSTK